MCVYVCVYSAACKKCTENAFADTKETIEIPMKLTFEMLRISTSDKTGLAIYGLFKKRLYPVSVFIFKT